MNSRSSGSRGDIGHVKDEVPDLSVEDVCWTKPEYTSGLIFISVNHTKAWTAEVGGCNNGRYIVRVTDQLGVVVVDDRGGDEVCAGGEVYYSRCSGRGLASTRSTTSTAADGVVDRSSVV